MGMVYYHLFLFVPRVLEVRAAKGLGNGYSFGDDFYPVWLTSREAVLHHREPYSPAMTREIQIGLFGRPLDAHHVFDPPLRYREFAYPAFVDIIFWPVAYLPFPVVRVLLAAFLPIMTAAGILLWLKAMRFRAGPRVLMILVLLVLSSYPILEALFAEQLGLVVGFLLAAAILTLTEEKYILAGTLLALTTIKPQMVILLIFFLLLWSLAKWRERRRFLESFAATEVLLCGSALLVWPHWLQQWVGILFDYRNYSSPMLVIDLLGPKFGPIFGPALMAVFIGLGMFVAWRVRLCSFISTEFWLAIALLLSVTAVAILPGQAVYDQIVLLPGIILVLQLWRSLASTRRAIRWLMAVATGALFWQWIAALGLASIRPLISSTKFYSVEIFTLPIRMAELFPFALLALLVVLIRDLLQGGSPTRSPLLCKGGP